MISAQVNINSLSAYTLVTECNFSRFEDGRLVVMTEKSPKCEHFKWTIVRLCTRCVGHVINSLLFGLSHSVKRTASEFLILKYMGICCFRLWSLFIGFVAVCCFCCCWSIALLREMQNTFFPCVRLCTGRSRARGKCDRFTNEDVTKNDEKEPHKRLYPYTSNT